jgi:hypothetical protein
LETVCYFRQKARECRRLSDQIGTRSDPVVASLRDLANEFDNKAAQREAELAAASNNIVKNPSAREKPLRRRLSWRMR